MKITKPILLIFLATVLFASCGNNEVNEEELKSETVKQEENNLTEKAKEQQENSVDYLENVDVSEVKYNWQKNLFWFIAQKITE